VANERESTIGALAEEIKKMTNSTSEIKYIDAPKKRYDYEVGRRFGSSSKLLDYVNYKPNTQLPEGLNVVYTSLLN